MHIGVVVFIIMANRIEHRARLLRRSRIIEVNQRVTMHWLAQNRKIFATGLPIEIGIHALICLRQGTTPETIAPKKCSYNSATA